MKKLTSFLLFIALLTFISSCEYDSFDRFPDNIEEINKDSELFNSIKNISTNKSKDTEPVCVIFVYPFNIYLFNSEAEIVDSKIINNNLEFIELLANTEGNNGGVGLSYPITSTLEDGNEFIIHNNAELKSVIEACIETEIIGICEDILEEKNCIWQITSLTDNQRYNSSLLDFYNDGTGVFYDNGNAYRTSWVSLFIENELHVNIHLEGDSEVTEDWNFDWSAVIIDDNVMEITNDDQKYTIKKQCGVENSCDYVEFKECIIGGSDDKAEFVFDNYKDCIISLQENVTNPTLSFYETLEHAKQETNMLDVTTPYLNTSNPQLVYVRVKNEDIEEPQIIRIILFAETCTDNNEN
ncbi:hypothetical protein ABW636_14780 [Aquimarina sp. 2201CG1-2-11]|uniref:hypothetical protein n=1 Tax=Aquimarina discodermiae TaxID=3231043 RepID=UPI003461A393